MDTRLIEHILKIYDEKSITKAAEKLYLTQSALNQQLLHLEHELGTPLFKRSKVNWGPTKAGEIYLEGAREMLRIKQRTYGRISDLTKGYKGIIKVGMPPSRGPEIFIHVYPKFHEKYPELTVIPYEENVFSMQKRISSGDLDLGLMTLFESQKGENEYLSLYEEEIVIAVPGAWDVEAFIIPRKHGLPALSLDVFREKPLILLRKVTTMRVLIDKLFRLRQITPHILFDTANPSTIMEMVRAGIACGIVAEFATRKYREEGIQYFSYEKPLKWNVSACYPKGTFLNKAMEDFIEMVKEYCVELGKQS